MIIQISSLFLLTKTAFAANAITDNRPVQTYFIPLPENQLFDETFATINSDSVGWPIQSTISIAIAANNTIIYYDHWEDGYELDVTNPKQSTTEIWGDGDLSNGGKPGATTDAEDILEGGKSYVLQNSIPENYEFNKMVPYKCDGSDRVQASLPIAMTRSAFPSSPGALMAGAVEIFNTASWGKYFIAPIGINTGSNTRGHESVVTYVMAGEDKTEVKRNGNFIATLDAGQSFIVKDTVLGDTFTSDKAIQVDILAGDIGSNYELRWLAQIPREKWGDTYLSPVGEKEGPTAFVLYNPNPTDLIVQYDGAGFCSTPPCQLLIPSEDDLVVVVDRDIELSSDYSGIKFTANEDFYAYTEVDADGMGNIFDWSFPMIPIDQTTSQVLVGDGRGCRSSSCDLQSQNKGLARSSLWVTCEDDCDIKLYLNGISNDPYEELFKVPKLNSTRFYPDEVSNDYTGAIIVASKTGTDDPTNIAVAWGQDPRRSYSNDNDGLDLGTAIVPLANPFVAMSVVNITNPDGSLDSDNIVDQTGDTINYKVTISNVGFGDIEITQAFSTLLDKSLGVNNIGFANSGELYEFGNGDEKLSPGETWTYWFPYEVDANDTGKKSIKNLVTISTTDFPPVSDDILVDVKLVSISGYLLEDTDENNTGDDGIAGVMIELYDGLQKQNKSTVTDSNGYYEFPDLEAGDYTIITSQPSGYVAVSDVGDPFESPVRTNQIDVTLNGESNLTDQNFIQEIVSSAPSKTPSSSPSFRPSIKYSVVPSVYPSTSPSFDPTSDPTFDPTFSPTISPTSSPTSEPTSSPTSQPTQIKSELPSILPTHEPSLVLSSFPTAFPSFMPTSDPTASPTSLPTFAPTSTPTSAPTLEESSAPSWDPTDLPSRFPTQDPTRKTNGIGGEVPTFTPSFSPSSMPSTPIIKTAPPIQNFPTSAPSIAPSIAKMFCEVIAPDQACSLCAPYRSPDYCPSDESFPSLIKSRTQAYNTDLSRVVDDGYWFPYLEDKVAGYRHTVEMGYPAPQIFCCETDLQGVQNCLNTEIPASIDGVVIKAATMHSSQGVYVLLNDNQSDDTYLELLTGIRMTYADVLASLNFVQATKIIVEEFIGSELPMEYKFHVTGGEVHAVNVVASRGADCQCYAVVDTDWNRLDKFGCFEPANVGFLEDQDNDKCTAIDFDAGKKNIGPVKKDMYLCNDVPKVDDCLWEEMQTIALALGESIGVAIRVDMFIANNQIYVQEYATNHMNGLRHCAAKQDENGCIDSCFIGRAWKEAGAPYGGVPKDVPLSLENYHLKSTSEMCDLAVGVASIYTQKSCSQNRRKHSFYV